MTTDTEAVAVAQAPATRPAAEDASIRPFTVHMPDADNDAPAFDPPNAERVYRNYLATCRGIGIEPVLRGHARELMSEWTVALASRGSAPPTPH